MIADKRVNDITGKRFSNLVVIRRTSQKSHGKYRLWECQCDCGNKCLSESYKLTRGSKRSCGCLNGGRPLDFIHDRESVLWKRQYSSTIQKRSKKKGYITDILLEDFIKISQEPCHYCNDIGVHLLKDRSTDSIIRFNGIDRVDSSGKYVKSNVVSCCKHCNMAKNTLSQKEFKTLIRKIYVNFT